MTIDPNNSLQRRVGNIHTPFSNFVRAQTTASWVLLLATIVALWWANSDYSSVYQSLTHIPIGVSVGGFELQASFKHIINDGLMVIFFFLLGLEIKREVIAGDIAQTANRRMLILCAVGGMVFPAAIYAMINWSLDSQIGWGIPMATDTAFALGALSIVRKHIPRSLLAFLVGLAIVDDVGAILVIAIFYSQDISILPLFISFALIAFLALANYAGISRPIFYIVTGIAAWWAMLKSGVHPTFAGVAIALTVPARPKLTPEKLLDRAKATINSMLKKTGSVDVLGERRDHDKVLEVRDIAERASTPLRRWEDTLGLPVSLFVLPLFALVNAGVPFSYISLVESLQHPAGLGIITGLVLGKFIGISGACWLGLRYKIGSLPDGVNLQHVIWVSLVAGIGFTMSTFIATPGFDFQPGHLQTAKTAILLASIISAIFGILYLRYNSKLQSHSRIEE